MSETRETVARLIAENRRALHGLAHADRGERVPGCDCCFCAPGDPGRDTSRGPDHA